MLGLAAILHFGGVLAWIAHYGYFAIAFLLALGIVGLPVPDETLLAFSGYLVWRGQLSLPFTLLAGFLGSVCGITASYVLGRTAGCYLVRRFGRRLHAGPEQMERTHAWFARYGRWTLSIGYFIPGVRHLTALSAGVSRLSFASFALFAYAGALVWVCTFVILGRMLGAGWKRLEGVQYYVLIVVGVLALLLGIVYLVVRGQRRRRRAIREKTSSYGLGQTVR